MITESRTYHSLPSPRKPDWVADSPPDVDETFVVGGAALIAGLVVGFLVALIGDATVFNGPGLAPPNDISGRAIAGLVFGTGGLFAVISMLFINIAPRLFKSTYFTNQAHMNAHVQYMELSPASRAHAQVAYDAPAVFNTGKVTSERALVREAQQIWQETYAHLHEQDISGDSLTQESLVAQARDTLKAIQS